MSTVLFSFNPNWARPVRERLEWKTDVLEAKDDSEERISLRSFPRRFLEFDVQVREHAAQMLDSVLWPWMAKRFTVPIWSDGQVLQGTLSAGSSVVPCETATYDFRPGAQAVLWGNYGHFELVNVLSVGSNSINLDGTTMISWSAGTRLYPTQNGRLPAEVQVLRPVDNVAQATFQFALENAPVSVDAAGTTYRGAEVNMRKPNWISGMRDAYSRKTESEDNQVGVPFVDDRSGLQRIVRTHLYLLRDRVQAFDFRHWLLRCMGRAHGFWQPQWYSDMTVSAGMSSGSTTMTVKALNYASNYSPAAGRQDVLIRNRATGQVAMRRITFSSSGAGTETFTLDSPLGFNATVDELAVCWLTFSRLDADAVEFAWHTTFAAEATVDIRSIREP